MNIYFLLLKTFKHSPIHSFLITTI